MLFPLKTLFKFSYQVADISRRLNKYPAGPVGDHVGESIVPMLGERGDS